MKIKCPECDEVMVKNEEAHVCGSCDHTLTLVEAEEMFEDGKLIGEMEEGDVLEEEEVIAEMDDEDEVMKDKKGDKKPNPFAKKDDDEDEKKEESVDTSFNGYANKETWASSVVTENEYSLLKKIKEAHKKEKLDSRFVQSLVEGAKESETLAPVFEAIELEAVAWDEVTDYFTQVMSESDEIAVDVANALFADVELNEEQKDDLINIFETAVDIKVNEIKAGLLEDHDVRIEEALVLKEQELEDQTAKYVDRITEEWYEENKIAIENSLKVEYAEDFIDKLHDLFEQSFINVPEDRFDVLESLNDRITKYEEYEVYVADETLKLEETITSLKKDASVKALTEGMVDTEKEKLAGIVESVDYKDEEQFVAEVTKLKEAFISKADTHLDEDVSDKDDKPTGIDADILEALKL